MTGCHEGRVDANEIDEGSVKAAGSSREAGDRAVVLDGRKRIVEMVQQRTPLRVRQRTTEPLRVILDRVPPDAKHVPARLLKAPFKIKPPESSHRGDDRLRAIEGCLELGLLARLHIEDREFGYHHTIVTQRSGDRGRARVTVGRMDRRLGESEE